MSLLLVVCTQVCGYYTAPKPYREERCNLVPMSRRLLMHPSPPSAAPRPVLPRSCGRGDSAAQLQVGAVHSNGHRQPWALIWFPQDLHCTTTMACSQRRFHRGGTRALRTNRRSRGSGTALGAAGSPSCIVGLGCPGCAWLRPAPPSKMQPSLHQLPLVNVSTFHGAFHGADRLCGCSGLTTQLGEVSREDFPITLANRVKMPLSASPALHYNLDNSWYWCPLAEKHMHCSAFPNFLVIVSWPQK